MAGGHRKFRSAQAFGKRRKQRPRARTLSPVRPSAAENSDEAGCASAITAAAPAIADAIAASHDHTRAVRVDTPLVSDAEKQETPPKHRYNLPEYVVDALRPVYTRLSDKKLLERCQRGKTQNPNESLHSVIWSLVSKNKHASLFTVEAAVAEAVARFNAGKGRADAAILKELHLQQSVVAAERCSEKDSRRLVASERKHEHAENFEHAMKRKRTKENDDDYVPGGF
ncbi:hypothetical protein HPB52_005808 [Rhipicephalus sanguineus]|uniref:Uncharacterized protein n=1 Tax=Rhipicephalus sanguineus TaxID=34632 RepID=A0A9D4Q980_RHISA|nr:hypothetical protein HPB52_005808 [Rhipicephalus sanguineus]